MFIKLNVFIHYLINKISEYKFDSIFKFLINSIVNFKNLNTLQINALDIVNKQETQSDIFIDRSQNSVFDVHLRLSEINNIDDLEKYGNGFYNIKK